MSATDLADELAALDHLRAVCSQQRMTMTARSRVRRAMQAAGVTSIRVGHRVFECPRPTAPLDITVLPAVPGDLPADRL